MANRLADSTDAANIGCDVGDLLVDPDGTGPFLVSLRYDRNDANMGSLQPGFRILVNGMKPFRRIQLYLGPLQGGTIMAYNQPVKIEAVSAGESQVERMQIFGGKSWKLSGKHIFGSDDVLGHGSRWAYRQGTYGFTFDSKWLYQTGNIFQISDDFFSNEQADGYEVEFIESTGGGFAGINAKNDGELLGQLTLIIHDCYIHDVGGEGLYIGETTQKNRLLGGIYNNIVARAGNDILQASNFGDGFQIYNNVVIGAAMRYRQQFQDGQSSIVQLSNRYGSAEFKNNIALLGNAHVVNHLPMYLDGDPDSALRGINDELLIENNLFGYSRRGSGIFNVKGDTPPNESTLPAVKYRKNFFIGLGENGNENWWGTGKIFGDTNSAYAVTVENNVIDSANPNITGLIPVSAGTETGTIFESLPLPKFVDDGITQKIPNLFKLSQWGTLGDALGNPGDTNVASPNTIDIADAATATFIGRKNRFGVEYTVGQELIVVANPGFEDVVDFLPSAYFIATIESVTHGPDLSSPYEQVTITFNTPSVSVGSGSYTDWNFGLVDEFLLDFETGDWVMQYGKLYECLQPNYFASPAEDVGADPVADGNGETVGTNWKLHWFNNKGTWTTNPPDDYRLKSEDTKYAGIGLTYNQPALNLTLDDYPNGTQPRFVTVSTGSSQVPYVVLYYPRDYYRRPDLLMPIWFQSGGDGEEIGAGNSTDAFNAAVSIGYLKKVFDDPSLDLPFIIACPVIRFSWGGSLTDLVSWYDNFIPSDKKIDRRRIWWTGLSNGAVGTPMDLNNLATYKLCGIVPTANYDNSNLPAWSTLNKVHWWGITNDGDNPSTIQNHVNLLLAEGGRTAQTRKTIMEGPGHGYSWTQTFAENNITITDNPSYSANNTPLNTPGFRVQDWVMDESTIRHDLATPPQQIINLQAEARADNIRVTWTNYCRDVADEIRLYRSENGGAYTLIATLHPTDDIYADSTGLSATNDYSYYAVSSLGGVDADDSNTSTVTFTGEVQETVPANPTNLQATPTQTQISLTWEDNSDNETGFRVERKAGSGGTYATIATKAANENAHVDTDSLQAGTTYFYRVWAVNAQGDSIQPTNEVSASLVQQYRSKIAEGIEAATANQEVIINLSDLNLKSFKFHVYAENGSEETDIEVLPFSSEDQVTEPTFEDLYTHAAVSSNEEDFEIQVAYHQGHGYLCFEDENNQCRIAKVRLSDGVLVDEQIVFATALQNDIHQAPSIGISKDGYIHVTAAMHHSGTSGTNFQVVEDVPWQYWVSDSPGDISSFTFQGDTALTLPGNFISYPRFFVDRHGELYCVNRGGVRDNLTWIPGITGVYLSRYNASNRQWTALGEVPNFSGALHKCIAHTSHAEGGSGYQGGKANLWFTPSNRMYFSYTVNTDDTDASPPAGTNAFRSSTDLLVAYSDDDGVTWRDIHGDSVSLPLDKDSNSTLSLANETPADMWTRSQITVNSQNQFIAGFFRTTTPERYLKYNGATVTEIGSPNSSLNQLNKMSSIAFDNNDVLHWFNDGNIYRQNPGANLENFGSGFNTYALPADYDNLHFCDKYLFETNNWLLAGYDNGNIKLFRARFPIT